MMQFFYVKIVQFFVVIFGDGGLTGLLFWRFLGMV